MSKVTKTEGRFVETMIDDEAVVMDLDSGNFFSMTGTALAIWQLIDGNRDRDAIVAALTERYGQTAELQCEVESFLDDLAKTGFIASS